MKTTLKKIILGSIVSISASLLLIGTHTEVASARTLRGLIKEASRDINQYWRYQLNASGRNYTPPRLYAYTSSQLINTACGPSLPGNAFYCSVDNSISYDINFLADQYNKFGDYAVVQVLAHEWGHLVQHQNGISKAKYLGIMVELQADCLAGAYARRANDAGFLAVGDLGEAVQAAMGGGDTSIPWFDPSAHGTAGQRVTAFGQGLNGPGACFSRY